MTTSEGTDDEITRRRRHFNEPNPAMLSPEYIALLDPLSLLRHDSIRETRKNLDKIENLLQDCINDEHLFRYRLKHLYSEWEEYKSWPLRAKVHQLENKFLFAEFEIYRLKQKVIQLQQHSGKPKRIGKAK